MTKVWFVPAKEGTFGLVLIGYGNYRAQGGMNDQGLFFGDTTGESMYPQATWRVHRLPRYRQRMPVSLGVGRSCL